MATDVERARYLQFQRAQQPSLRPSGTPARKPASSFSLPNMMTGGLPESALSTPQAIGTEDFSEEERMEYLLAQQQLLLQQQQARQQQQQQQQAIATDAQSKIASAPKEDAIAKKKAHETAEKKKRLYVRPAQKALFTSSILGAPSVIIFLFFSFALVVWEMADAFKTFTKKTLPRGFDDVTAEWSKIDQLQIIVGGLSLFFVGMVLSVLIVMVAQVQGYLTTAIQIPFLTEILSFMLPKLH